MGQRVRDDLDDSPPEIVGHFLKVYIDVFSPYYFDQTFSSAPPLPKKSIYVPVDVFWVLSLDGLSPYNILYEPSCFFFIVNIVKFAYHASKHKL